MMDRAPSRRDFLSAGAAAALALTPARAQSGDLTALTLKKASDLLRTKAASPVDLTQACLKRIEKYNPSVNAFITVTREQALATAREMQTEIQRGKWRGPLHGIPIALKDNIDTAGIRTTGASELFKDRVPSEDAEVAARLKAEGAILLGKLNLHEFAYGGSSTVTYYGAIHNPWALDRTTGGSSGGPAAAIAADLCFGALGTDTAGSVRIPASYCSLVGFKPTYGRVSIRGVIPLSWTLDHVGPMCKTVEDAALMLNVVAGYDPRDATTVDVPVPDYARALKTPTAKLRLGVPRAPFFDNLDPEVSKAVNTAIEVLRKLTAGIADASLPPSGNPGQLWTPEAYVYHSKWIKESPERYQPSTRAALQRGADFKADAYIRARNEVEQLRRDIRKVFTNLDLLITPTMPAPPPLLSNPGGGSARNTSPFDVFGIPTISIPCGFTVGGLPIGLQISGAPWNESAVLALAHAYEQATEWHTRRPKLA
jgi:aspartyl-tRNA(Asn)/glutamyl-tRNA(Gln) amidotransferase subunit A